MSEQGDLDPDAGYWAARWDPDARSTASTTRRTSATATCRSRRSRWSWAAWLLWDLGGTAATLLAPDARRYRTAFAARAQARRLGDGEGWAAFTR